MEARLPKLLAYWALALLLLVPAVWTARFLPDELSFCNIAVRLAHGQVFGKDAFCLIMPGSFMFTALPLLGTIATSIRVAVQFRPPGLQWSLLRHLL